MSVFYLVIAVIRPLLFGGRSVSLKHYIHTGQTLTPPSMEQYGNVFELRRYFTSPITAQKWGSYLISTYRITPAQKGEQLLLFLKYAPLMIFTHKKSRLVFTLGGFNFPICGSMRMELY
jgi:hypothetical protein